jgi:hypothetical protein
MSHYIFQQYFRYGDFTFGFIWIFKDFAYTPWPSTQNCNMLSQAQHALLSVYASNKWNLVLTTHYMTTYVFQFLKIDQIAYFTLGEIVEHRNKVDKRTLKTL